MYCIVVMLYPSFHNEFLHSQLHVQPPLHSSACSAPFFVQRMVKYTSLTGHRGCVNTIHFTEDGAHAITGSDDTCIMFFDVNTGTRTASLETSHSNNIFYAQDVPRTNSSQLLTCAADGRVVHMNIEEHSSSTLHRHSGRAHRLALVPDEPDLFYSCGEDGKCYFYDLRTRTPTLFTTLNNTASYNVPIYMLGINPSRVHEIAIAGGLPRARTYDSRMGGNMWCGEYYPSHLAECGETITAIKYDHTGEKLVLSYNDEDIYTMDATSHNKMIESEINGPVDDYLRCFKGHRNSQTVKQVTYYGHNSEYVVSGSDCGHIFIWCAETGDLVKVLHGDSIGAINCLSPHPYLPMLGTAGLDRDAKLWLPLGQSAKYADMTTNTSLTSEQQEARIRSIIDSNDRANGDTGNVFGNNPLQLLRLMGFDVEDDEADEDPGPRRVARNQLLRLMEFFIERAEDAENSGEEEVRSYDSNYESSAESYDGMSDEGEHLSYMLM